MMAFSDDDQSSYSDPRDADFDAFLNDVSKDAERADLYYEISIHTVARLSNAARNHDVPLEKGTPLPLLQDVVKADFFRDHFAETIILLNVLHERAFQAKDYDAIEALYEQKKDIMASYIVSGCFAQGDGWYKVIDELIPGDAIDENNPDDIPYFVKAINDLEATNELAPLVDEVCSKVAEIIELHGEQNELDADAQDAMFKSVIDVYEIGLNDTIRFEAKIDELARACGFAHTLAQRLKSLGYEYVEHCTFVE